MVAFGLTHQVAQKSEAGHINEGEICITDCA